VSFADGQAAILSAGSRVRPGADIGNNEKFKWESIYRFAANLNLGDLIGSEIQQICLGPADVQFGFGSGTCIAAQSRATLTAEESVLSEWTATDGGGDREAAVLVSNAICMSDR